MSLQLRLDVPRRSRDRRRPVRDAGRGDEPGRCPAVDPLAGLPDPGVARGGQRVVHGVPVPRAPDPRPPLAPRPAPLAAPAPRQVAGRDPGRAVLLVVRGVLPSGTAPAGPPGSRSDTSSRPSRSTASSGARRSANTSARSASSTSSNRSFPPSRSRSAKLTSAARAGRRTASEAATTACMAASWASIFPGNPAISTAPSASTASTSARTTTSASSRSPPGAAFGASRTIPGSDGSAIALTSRS